MKQQILKMTGLTEDQFYKRYPSEQAFFRDYPQARQMLQGIPKADDGLQVEGPGPFPSNAPVMPNLKDFSDYKSYADAWGNWAMGIQQKADMSQRMPQGQPVPQQSVSSTKLKDYQGVSVHDFLTAQGKAGDYKSRKNLAKTLGIADYRGTRDQNKLMMDLIRQNPNVLNNYTGYTPPVGNTVKKAATAQNRKATPTTEELAAAKQKQQQRNNDVKYIKENTLGRDIVTGAPIIADIGALESVPRQYTVAEGYYGMPNDAVYASDVDYGGYRNSYPKVRMNPQTMRYEAIPDPNGLMTAESMMRMKLADKLNQGLQQGPVGGAQLRQGRGYAGGGNVYPDGYSGTYSAGQYYNDGGSYMPQYGASAYGLPQFELGAPIYADGGMSPEEAMMAQQQMQGASPQEQPQMDQQQIVNAVMQMIQQGAQPDQIIQELVSMGLPQELAMQIVQQVAQQMQGGAMEQQAGMPPAGAEQMPPQAGGMPPEQGMMPPPMGMYGGSYAQGGMIGQEMEVTPQQLEDLKRKGIKFEIV